MKKIFIFLFFTSLLYSQKRQVYDECAYLPQNHTTDVVMITFEDAVLFPEEKGEQFFGCGTAWVEQSRKISCEKRQLLFYKYKFVLDEIEKHEAEENELPFGNVLWLQNSEKSNRKLHLSDNDEKKIKEWISSKDNSKLSVFVLVDKISRAKEFVQIKLWKPNESNKQTKTFKLYVSKKDWHSKIINK